MYAYDKFLVLYDQAVFTDPAIGTHGDCFRACIRTLLQDDMPDLPLPLTSDGKWNADFDAMLREKYGYRYRLFRTPGGFVVPSEVPRRVGSEEQITLPRVVIASGRSARSRLGSKTHAVLWDRMRRRVIHDPHPSRAGLLDIRHVAYALPIPQ